jgi:hypothetical protein
MISKSTTAPIVATMMVLRFLLSEHVTWAKRNCGRDERRGRRQYRTSMHDFLLCLRKGRYSHSGNAARKRIAGLSAPAKKNVGR